MEYEFEIVRLCRELKAAEKRIRKNAAAQIIAASHGLARQVQTAFYAKRESELTWRDLTMRIEAMHDAMERAERRAGKEAEQAPVTPTCMA